MKRIIPILGVVIAGRGIVLNIQSRRRGEFMVIIWGMNYPHALFLYTATVKVCDALTVALTWIVCWYLRFSFLPIFKGVPSAGDYHKLAPVIALIYLIVFHIVGAYRRDRIFWGFRSFKKIFEGAILGLLTFVSILYFKNEADYSRLFLLLFPALVIPALLLERLSLQLAWNYLLKHSVRDLRVLLVGTGEVLQSYVQRLLDNPTYPTEWIGWLRPKDDSFGCDLPVGQVGFDEDLYAAIREKTPDLVMVSYPTRMGGRLESVLRTLENELVDIRILPDFGKYNTFTYSAANDFGFPCFVLNQATTGTTALVLKRLFDIMGSAFLILISSPLWVLIALITRLSSKGPILFSQIRVGADGKVFTLYKFRTMRMEAEAATGPVWATKGDERTTAFGKWLRKTSLDETPQFFNVLKGDMSLVGPRPERPYFVEQFRDQIPKYMLRHKMKSGITGWAQVNGWRGNTSLEERIKHDLFYIGHWSHLLDLKILIMTLWKGFVNQHAY